MCKIILAVLSLLFLPAWGSMAQKSIRISTDQTDLVLQVPENGRLYQT